MKSTTEPIHSWNKGLGIFNGSLTVEEIVRLGWNLLNEDLTLPAAVLSQDRLRHNLEWMREFVAAYGARLAPHGKTTMAPKLFQMQLEHGAWGITLATVQQTLVAHAHGVRRVLMANQLIGKANLAAIARLLQDPEFDYYCLVDSAAQVEQLGNYFSQSGLRLQVLLELGVDGGRTGVRRGDQLQLVLESLARWNKTVVLCGVEMYEGVLDDEASIRAFLRRAVEITGRLAREERFQRDPVLLSGAGSAWYDVVAEEFSEAITSRRVDVLLRPGCYLTHDVGSYRRAQNRILACNSVAQKMDDGLQPALQVWAYVLSLPEAQKAIVGMGRRDAAFDSGLPVPALHFRPGSAEPQPAPPHWSVTKMMDQHAYMQTGADDDLRVGDMIGFDICHPCLTFDKWRTIPVLDASYRVVDVVQTFF
ncbi:MAG TPA: amino acid deaminase [Terracidiphilus sp.]|nr:amino acid deaminase [Terracidiphilus sp.]